MTDIPTLRRLLAEATPGPWQSDFLNDDGAEDDPSWVGISTPGLSAPECTVVAGDGMDGMKGKRNAALIVALRNAAPGLLDELDRRERLLDEAKYSITAFAESEQEQRDEIARLRRLADASVAYLDCLESPAPQHDDCLDDYGCGARADWENATEDERAARTARGTKGGRSARRRSAFRVRRGA